MKRKVEESTDCCCCGHELYDTAVGGVRYPKEVGPNKYVCSYTCECLMEGAYCETCKSWVPEDNHTPECEYEYRKDLYEE